MTAGTERIASAPVDFARETHLRGVWCVEVGVIVGWKEDGRSGVRSVRDRKRGVTVRSGGVYDRRCCSFSCRCSLRGWWKKGLSCDTTGVAVSSSSSSARSRDGLRLCCAMRMLRFDGGGGIYGRASRVDVDSAR